MHSNRSAQIVLFAILLLFFLQVLTDFIQSIYAFGLLVTAFTIQLASVLLLFTPLILLFLRRPPSRPWMVGMACVAMLGRLLEPLLNPGGRLVACGISVGAFMLLFPMMLSIAKPARPSAGWRLASGLLIAVSLSIFLRTVNSSLDISEYSIYQFIAWVLAVWAARLIWTWEVSGVPAEETQPTSLPKPLSAAPGDPGQEASYEERRQQSLRSLEESSHAWRKPKAGAAPQAGMPMPETSSTLRVLGLCIGLASVIVMLYFAFASPAVIARWTGSSLPAILAVLTAVLAAFAIWFSWSRPIHFPSRRVVLIWNGLFVLMLVLTILPHQVAFPARPDAYPLDAPSTSPLAQIPLYLMLVLSPVIFIDFMLYARQLWAEAPSIRQLGGGFALAALFILVMVFLHVFTTIYDYAAPIGPLFRDRFWLVYLLAGLALALPALLVREWTADEAPPLEPHSLTAPLIGVMAILSIAASLRGSVPPSTGELQNLPMRVMTYNIQQGFDKIGDADLPGQLAAIERVRPDVLGLEESDTARIANGNVDAVRYFADKLGMFSYYGPTTTTGTFGIALLSRYPIQDAHTFFLYSTGEQTAAIQAQIVVNGKTYNVFVTHLGNGGPMVQLQEVLKRVEGLPNVILVGDFNFDPSTAQYALAARSLEDAWRVRWPSGYQYGGPGSASEHRIDLIWVSPGTRVTDSEYVPDSSSDHPYLYAVVGQ